MNHLNKPNNIGVSEWNELLKKYNNNIPSEIEILLKKHYPIQYIIGNVEFYNNKIKVDESVLIPRYETELLVSKIIKRINNNQINPEKIFDLCTGSGAIAISLSKYSKDITAIDISEEALNLAQENAILNNAKIKYIKKDILKDNFEIDATLIVSNPPYVTKEEYVGEETKYEPQIALYAEDSGLEFYKKIIKLCKNNKSKRFYIAFEIGATQSERIKQLILEEYPNSKIEIEKDFNNYDRYIFISIND